MKENLFMALFVADNHPVVCCLDIKIKVVQQELPLVAKLNHVSSARVDDKIGLVGRPPNANGGRIRVGKTFLANDGARLYTNSLICDLRRASGRAVNHSKHAASGDGLGVSNPAGDKQQGNSNNNPVLHNVNDIVQSFCKRVKRVVDHFLSPKRVCRNSIARVINWTKVFLPPVFK